MLSLIGSLIGFSTSFLPKIMDYFQDKQDKAFELAMQDKVLEQHKVLGAIKLENTRVDASVREMEALLKSQSDQIKHSSQWCVNLSASVRPVISYAFFIEFGILTLAVNMDWMTMAQYQMIWNEPMQAIFASVVCFWFGQRTFGKNK